MTTSQEHNGDETPGFEFKKTPLANLQEILTVMDQGAQTSKTASLEELLKAEPVASLDKIIAFYKR